VDSPDRYKLQRFVDAHQSVIDDALSELAAGAKRSHWMWFVFPQLGELGRSPTAKFYGLASIKEARAYLRHPILGSRLTRCVETLLPWASERSAERIFGPIDSMKLRSSMTLFDRIEPDGLFAQALLNFFGGKRDELTLALLERRR
jgi:uncharacterized protein (DUF1810 family)